MKFSLRALRELTKARGAPPAYPCPSSAFSDEKSHGDEKKDHETPPEYTGTSFDSAEKGENAENSDHNCTALVQIQKPGRSVKTTIHRQAQSFSSIPGIQLIMSGGEKKRPMLLVQEQTSIEAYDVINGQLVWQLSGSHPRFKQNGLVGLFNGPIAQSHDQTRFYTVINNNSSSNPGTSLLIDSSNGHIVASAPNRCSVRAHWNTKCFLSDQNTMIATPLTGVKWNSDKISIQKPDGGYLHDEPRFVDKVSCTLDGCSYGQYRDIDVAFSPDQKHIISVSRPWLEEHEMYDAEMHDRVIINIHNMAGNAERCHCVPISDRAARRDMNSSFHFPTDDKWLVCCSFDGIPKVRLLDVMTGAIIGVLTGGPGILDEHSLSLVLWKGILEKEASLAKLSTHTKCTMTILKRPDEPYISVRQESLEYMTTEKLTITRIPNLAHVEGEVAIGGSGDAVVQIARDAHFIVLPSHVITAKLNAADQSIGIEIFAI